jgi:hypothetical protein
VAVSCEHWLNLRVLQMAEAHITIMFRFSSVHDGILASEIFNTAKKYNRFFLFSVAVSSLAAFCDLWCSSRARAHRGNWRPQHNRNFRELLNTCY